MNRFLTLIRRDMADNRGALVITPIVIAAILMFVTVVASLTGQARFGFDPNEFRNNAKLAAEEFKAEIEADGGEKVTVTRGPDGKIRVTGEDGQTRVIDEALDRNTLKGIETVLPVGTAVASSLPISVAAIAILFVLAGALHDERKDRSILFWKSMPVSDIQTVGAKLVSVVGGGLLTAFVVGVLLHIGITTVAVLTIGNVGISDVSLLTVLANASKLWIVLLFGLIIYIGWALPVYGWVSMVSAWAPKMPFVAAFAPLVVVPLVYMAVAFKDNEDDPLFQALWAPAGRLVGAPVFDGLGAVIDKETDSLPVIPVSDMLAHLAQSLAQPTFWLGLVIAAGFVVAASEIRRRRAL
jgi:ABC-2 type transport system permease protein